MSAEAHSAARAARVAPAYAVHPLAHLLPELRDAEYAELRDDIAANGLLEAITLYEDQILDGRHRYLACGELDIGAHFTVYEGDTPAQHVYSLNVKRRQLTQSQRAMLATDFLPYLQAEGDRGKAFREAPRDSRGHVLPLPESKDSDKGLNLRSAARAAKQAGVGHAQVIRANKVKRENPELAERVRNGEITVGAALGQVNGREKPAKREKRQIASLNTERGQQQAVAHKRRLIELVSTLTGISRGLNAIDADLLRDSMGPKELDEWARQLGDALTKFQAFRTELRKARN